MTVEGTESEVQEDEDEAEITRTPKAKAGRTPFTSGERKHLQTMSNICTTMAFITSGVSRAVLLYHGSNSFDVQYDHGVALAGYPSCTRCELVIEGG